MGLMEHQNPASLMESHEGPPASDPSSEDPSHKSVTELRTLFGNRIKLAKAKQVEGGSKGEPKKGSSSPLSHGQGPAGGPHAQAGSAATDSARAGSASPANEVEQV